MDYQNFYGEESPLPTPYLRILTKISKWKDYDCVEINGYKFIKGSGGEEPNLFEFKEICDAGFFWALMTLHHDLSPQLFTSFQAKGNAAITDNDVKLIIKFCKSHGLPFWNTQLDHAPFKNISNRDFLGNLHDPSDEMENNLLHEIIPIAQYNSFPISSFAVGLKSLWYDFLQIINYYKWDDYTNISMLLTPEDKSKLSKMKANHLNIDLHTPSLVSFPTYWDENLLSLRLNCENLMHLSVHHLCLLMQSGTLGSGIIKTCPKCHKQFVAKRRNQKFCGNPCTPQSFHMQKKRSENNLQKGAN